MITILNAVGTPRSIHLLVFWILFENVMSLHRTKATIIGLLEASRVNEWIVTEKLGDALRTLKAATNLPRKSRFRIGERLHVLELAVGLYLFFCGCYDFVFGKNYFFMFLYIQATAFFIIGFGVNQNPDSSSSALCRDYTSPPPPGGGYSGLLLTPSSWFSDLWNWGN
ncbi:glucomannan 4-beta-mannosyltransferase 9-like [Pyrus ussuriensis x Pyrus communis]|uniref:Glucomannan 4-beta-mannosyltransferase 9-like n=1 Tax=Pyrus ussuriensis x Pyrus communis TaxID=2448454 RepID=A0A5N5FX97_9ROSA|nr:glucomannan 4-beta-mannosyltransferase 9-like [Pyrus ussuriensis x Pyrus communis]